MSRARRIALAAAAPLALLVTLLVAVRIGATGVGYADIGRVIGTHLGLPVQPLPRLTDSVIWQLRIPRVLLAALVGAALAVCGAVLQAITRNSLADPYLLGVSNGASTGAVAVVVLGVGASSIGITGGAFAGAALAFTLMLLLLRRSKLHTVRIVLIGVIVGQLFAAVTSLILMASADPDTTRAITYWLLGSLSSARWDSVVVTAIAAAVGLGVIWVCARSLDVLALGHETAAGLGVDVRRTRLVLLVATALLTSVAVASVGAIGFVGLIVPHGVRFLVGPEHRVLLPYTALVGAMFLVWTDALARVAYAPREVPVGVFTALVGVPLFLLVSRKRGEL
ncbi:FecCD family ABC transporter permease [Kibdelosporangium phytohabitans]|uniref:ABC transporter permease n=1 Tax=Kibdelosporangium phytohabitans TaxID=860235 RepID=A0A0N9HP15_9PSEU|nr:iron chelate uptake ABC transporter family permease subunit [Kibdelosporangium phytohabitans]ALG08748.1 ABC transporter permease [Kibdelosporangium phytohabitans]MBE1470135.1 iron complex transport system permease protein [Kibdelosporangium phytohabitans]